MRCDKELHSQLAYIHPEWKQRSGSAYDAAILRLSIRIPIPTPVLAAPEFRLDPDDWLYTLKLRYMSGTAELNDRESQICVARDNFLNGTLLY